MSHPLDRPIWHALSHRQAAFARGNALALRYATEYAPFAATRDESPSSLSALYDIIPPGGGVALFTRDELTFPENFSITRRAHVTQMILSPTALAGAVPALPPTARPLQRDDAQAMQALVALTQPGPFAERTWELGHFLGVFVGDSLAAMAGERICLEGFVEISAVCTHPDHRGQGLAASLIATLAGAAFERGETPFLHTFADNKTAFSVYRKLGFVEHAMMNLAVVSQAKLNRE